VDRSARVRRTAHGRSRLPWAAMTSPENGARLASRPRHRRRNQFPSAQWSAAAPRSSGRCADGERRLGRMSPIMWSRRTRPSPGEPTAPESARDGPVRRRVFHQKVRETPPSRGDPAPRQESRASFSFDSPRRAARIPMLAPTSVHAPRRWRSWLAPSSSWFQPELRPPG
jgi:hypothetical protein